MTRHIVSIYTFLICVCALLSATAISCDNSKRMETLARVQKTFDKNPELALEMLDSIDPAHLKGKEETAKYGLLKFASLLKAGSRRGIRLSIAAGNRLLRVIVLSKS